MAIACTAFTALGLVMVAAGEGAERLAGVAVALLFGTAGAIWFGMDRLTKPSGEGVRTDVVTFRGSARPALVFPLSHAKRRLGLVGAVAFVAVGALLVVTRDEIAEIRYDPRWVAAVGIACIATFGLVAVIGLVNELSAGTSIALLPEGVVVVGPVSTFLAWDRIVRVGVVDVRGTRLVGVVAQDPVDIETGRVGRMLAWFGRRTMRVDLAFGGLVAPVDVLAEAIDYYVRHPEERARIGSAVPAAVAAERS